MNQVPSISGHDLGCMRGETAVFKGVSFKIPQGESLQVTGPNGVGKSSLLRLIADLIPVATGEILWDLPSSAWQRCLLINHKQGLKSHLTVAENLNFWFRLQATDTTPEKILNAWSICELADFPISSLSQGQRQRLNLCRLQMVPAWLWLLDEPFSGLDADGQSILCQLMLQHQQQGGAVLLATHQPIPDSSAWQPSHCLDMTPYCLVRGQA